MWDSYIKNVINTKSQMFTEKQIHGYLFKKVKEHDQFDKCTSWRPHISISHLILKGMCLLFMNRKLTPKIYNIDMT